MIHPAELLTLKDGRNCIIRSAEAEDAEKMLRYMKIMLGETPFHLRTPEEFSYTPEQEAAILEGRKNDPRSIMLVAEADGAIVASADISSHVNRSRVRHRAELGISVLREYWRQGIGGAMMERLISFAREAGYEQIELTVESKNSRALRLYGRYGFEIYGTRPNGMKYPDGSYDDDCLMIRKL